MCTLYLMGIVLEVIWPTKLFLYIMFFWVLELGYPGIIVTLIAKISKHSMNKLWLFDYLFCFVISKCQCFEIFDWEFCAAAALGYFPSQKAKVNANNFPMFTLVSFIFHLKHQLRF